MAKAKKFDLEDPASIPDGEDEETLAAIDEGIRDADAGRVVPAEKAGGPLKPRLWLEWGNLTANLIAPGAAFS